MNLSEKKRLKLPLPLPIFIVAVVCIALSVAFFLISSLAPRTLYDQYASEYFAQAGRALALPVAETTATDDAQTAPADAASVTDELRYSQVTAFLARGAGYSYTSFMQFRHNLAKRLETDGMVPANANANLWLDAASGTVEGVRISSDARSVNNVSVTAIVGDFFYFHPTRMHTGSAILPDAVSKDVIMVDAQTAWDAFGSYEIIGMRAELNGVACIVGGVFEKDENDVADHRIYASLEFVSQFLPSTELTILEFVLPGPVSGYGLQVIYNEDSNTGLLISVPKQNIVVVENSTRFETGKLFSTIKNLSAFISQTREIALPYWENAARIMTVKALVCFLFALLFAVYPAVIVIILLVKLVRRRDRFIPWVVATYKKLQARRNPTALGDGDAAGDPAESSDEGDAAEPTET